MSSNLNQREAALRAAMANATLDEQRRLASEIAKIEAVRAEARDVDRQTNMAASVVRDTMTPVLVHGMHTASTDWIGEQSTSFSGDEMSKISRKVRVEAGEWFAKTSSVVRSYQDEFAEQARGFARRTSSQYGTSAVAVESVILKHIASLYKQAEGTDAAGIASAADGMTNPEAISWTEQVALPGDDAPANEAPEGIEVAPYNAEYDDAATEDYTEGGSEFSSVGTPPATTASRKTARLIREIAADIDSDWANVNYAARPYLDAMYSLSDMSDHYYADDASSIVAYFLSNASSWRGETAKAIKKELNAMLKQVYGSRKQAGYQTEDGWFTDDEDYDGPYANYCPDCGFSHLGPCDDGDYHEGSINSTIYSRAAQRFLAAEEGTTPAQSPGDVDEEQSGEAGSTLPREVSVTDRPQSFPNFMENKPAADADSSRAKNISANGGRRRASVGDAIYCDFGDCDRMETPESRRVTDPSHPFGWYTAPDGRHACDMHEYDARQGFWSREDILAREGSRKTAETVTCTRCGNSTDSLAVFPGGICLECYESDYHPMPTADELTEMWGGPRRGSRRRRATRKTAGDDVWHAECFYCGDLWTSPTEPEICPSCGQADLVASNQHVGSRRSRKTAGNEDVVQWVDDTFGSGTTVGLFSSFINDYVDAGYWSSSEIGSSDRWNILSPSLRAARDAGITSLPDLMDFMWEYEGLSVYAKRKTAASGYFVQVKDETNEGYGYWANYYDADGMPLADVERIPTMAQVDSEALAYFGVERTEEWHAARGRGSDWIEAEVRSIGSYADKPYYATRKTADVYDIMNLPDDDSGVCLMCGAPCHKFDQFCSDCMDSVIASDPGEAGERYASRRRATRNPFGAKRSYRKTAMPNPTDFGVNVGDILVSSWGYDQTNIDFYEVTGLTGASVRVRPIQSRIVGPEGVPQEQVEPVKGAYIGPEMTKRVRQSFDDYAITVGYGQYAWPYDGRPRYQTGYGYGH